MGIGVEVGRVVLVGIGVEVGRAVLVGIRVEDGVTVFVMVGLGVGEWMAIMRAWARRSISGVAALSGSVKISLQSR